MSSCPSFLTRTLLLVVCACVEWAVCLQRGRGKRRSTPNRWKIRKAVTQMSSTVMTFSSLNSVRHCNTNVMRLLVHVIWLLVDVMWLFFDVMWLLVDVMGLGVDVMGLFVAAMWLFVGVLWLLVVVGDSGFGKTALGLKSGKSERWSRFLLCEKRIKSVPRAILIQSQYRSG